VGVQTLLLNLFLGAGLAARLCLFDDWLRLCWFNTPNLLWSCDCGCGDQLLSPRLVLLLVLQIVLITLLLLVLLLLFADVFPRLGLGSRRVPFVVLALHQINQLK
jgi:hypothetical protein